MAACPHARRLTLAGPADLARAAEALGLPGAVAAWADDAQAEYLALTGLDEPSAKALGGESARFGVRAATAGDRALLCGSPASLRSLAAHLANALDVPVGLTLGSMPPCGRGGGPSGPPPMRLGRWRLPFGRKTYVMAIVNLTPDSFSDDERRLPEPAEAAERARRALAEGADLIDLGAESSEARDHGPLDAAEEARRLLPVLDRLRDLPAPISVDTRHGAVARLVLEHGATLINDVEAGRDPELLAAAAAAGAGLVVMHDGDRPDYVDLVAEVAAFLEAAVDRAAAAGVERAQVIVDAGFGFAKTVHQDLELTRRLRELRVLGRAILHAPSRKRTIGRVLGCPETIPERLPGTAASVALGIAAGADIVRVHDVSEMARVARMADAVVRGTYDGEP